MEGNLSFEVPDNFKLIKLEKYQDWYDMITGYLGDNPKQYVIINTEADHFFRSVKLVGSKEYRVMQEEWGDKISKKFPNIGPEDQGTAKMEKLAKWLLKEETKLAKKAKYEGHINIFYSAEKIEDYDSNLLEIIDDISKMHKNPDSLSKDEIKEYQEWKELIAQVTKKEIFLNEYTSAKFIKFEVGQLPEGNIYMYGYANAKFGLPMFKTFQKIDYEILVFERGGIGIGIIKECTYIKCSPKKNNLIRYLKDPLITKSSAKNNVKKTTTGDEDIVSKIKELNKLYDDGILTLEEFEKAKKKLLD